MKLYNVKAKNKFKLSKDSTEAQKGVYSVYDGINAKDYDENSIWNSEPTEQDVLDMLKLLKPTKEFFIGGMQITFIQEFEDK